MSRLEKIALTGIFLFGMGVGAARSQTISGTVMNYDDGNPVSGIEVYLDGAIQDTTNAQGTFGFPVSIVRDGSPVIPKEFSLRLFPNPFNPSTFLEYVLPYKADVEIKVFNILGQEVYSKSLEDQLSGTYKHQFDANKYRLPTGMYFFQFEINPTNTAKQPLLKMIKGVYLK